ncbi:hypothetical protein JCM3765_001895 [Sporobolomyces pararoseus]
MSGSQPRTSMSSRSNRDDVLQFLDSLDTMSGQAPPTSSSTTSGSGLPRSTSTTSSLSHSQGPGGSTVGGAPKNAQEAQSVLDFLDEITSTNKPSSPPPPPTSRTSIDQARRTTTPGGTMRTTTSRSNLSQIASTGTSPQGTARKSTESVRSQRSGLDRSSPSPATMNRTLPTSSTSSSQTNQTPTSLPPSSAPSQPQPAQAQAQGQAQAQTQPSGGGWGWSSVWSTASTAINQASQLAQQARTVAEEQVRTNAGGLGEGLMKAWNHEDNPNGTGAEGAGAGGASGGMKKWTEGVQGLVKNANLEGLGKELKSTTLKSLTDLLNAVAPPIAEHEVIQVNLSHSMKGYDGVETLVYRGLSKIMDQIEGGTLMVNRATSEEKEEEKKTTEPGEEEEERNLNLVEGIAAGWKMSQDTLDKLISSTYKPPSESQQPGSPSSLTLPVTNCPVYLRLQPVLAPLPSLPSPPSTSASNSSPASSKQLYFLLLLIDPTHSLTHHTISQPLPSSWLDIPFEQNEWVEEFMVDAIRGATEVIGQEYITGRMRAQGNAIEAAKEEARKTIRAEAGNKKEGGDEAEEREVSTLSQEARVGVF